MSIVSEELAALPGLPEGKKMEDYEGGGGGGHTRLAQDKWPNKMDAPREVAHMEKWTS